MSVNLSIRECEVCGDLFDFVKHVDQVKDCICDECLIFVDEGKQNYFDWEIE